MKFFAAVSPLVLLAGQGALAAGNGRAARNGQGNANRANNNANAAAAVAAGGRPQDNPNGTTRINYPIPRAPDASANGQINTQAVDAGTLQRASTQWMTDTGIVSGFLNDGPTITDDQTFKSRAKRAYNAEVNELTQKAILERAILNDPAVSVANLTLTNGSFQNVVDNLLAMSVKGPSSASLIDVINTVRCPQVLPSIDTYMAATNQAVGGGLNSAVRPQACATVTRAPVDTYGIAGVNNPVAGLQINNLQTGQVAGANGINGAVPSAGAVGNAGQANANADGNGRNANGGRGNAGARAAGGNVNALGNRAGAGNLIAGANRGGGSNLAPF